MMLPFKSHLHNGKYVSTTLKGKYVLCTKRKIYAAQNRKYTLHKTENIRCTKQKIYVAQNRKYTLHKTENIRYKENRIYVAQKRIQTTENGKWNTLPGFHLHVTVTTSLYL